MIRPALLALLVAAAVAADRPPAGPLNVVLILVDDLGWSDLACYGNRSIETPAIDRLATQGQRFTDAYAGSPVCSPTRAAILTGRHPARLHLTDWIPGHGRAGARLRIPDWTQHLPLEEVTLAEAFKAAGYATAAIGKWHLGGEAFYPEKQGFDRNIGGTNKGQPPSYHAPFRIPTLQPESPAGTHLSDREAAEAVAFIKEHRERPFFLYLPQYGVHTPIQPRKDLLARYQARPAPAGVRRDSAYAALVSGVDEGVGRVLAALDEHGLAERTVVVFTSDNGGLSGPSDNAPLRSGKGTVYEGGIRVPLIVRWPGVTRAGATCAEPTHACDLFPTVLAAAGIDPATAVAGKPLDGVSLMPVLRDPAATLGREALYWHYPHYHKTTPVGAIRQGSHVLLEYFEDMHVELYDLAADLGQKTDLAGTQPELAGRLRARLHAWRAEVGAQMPTPVGAAPAGGSEESRK